MPRSRHLGYWMLELTKKKVRKNRNVLVLKLGKAIFVPLPIQNNTSFFLCLKTQLQYVHEESLVSLCMTY